MNTVAALDVDVDAEEAYHTPGAHAYEVEVAAGGLARAGEAHTAVADAGVGVDASDGRAERSVYADVEVVDPMNTLADEEELVQEQELELDLAQEPERMHRPEQRVVADLTPTSTKDYQDPKEAAHFRLQDWIPHRQHPV